MDERFTTEGETGGMTDFLQKKIAGVAGKYVDLVEKQIEAALESEDIGRVELGRINNAPFEDVLTKGR